MPIFRRRVILNMNIPYTIFSFQPIALRNRQGKVVAFFKL